MADEGNQSSSPLWRKIMLVLNCIVLVTGMSGGPLITRLYFLHGGARIWLSSALSSAGFPFILITLIIAYLRRCSETTTTTAKLFFMQPRIFIGSIVIGLLTGADNYFYSYGLSKVPVSTGSLIIAAGLVFTAVFAFLLVKQKFTSYRVNAVVLLTIGAAVLGIHANSERPAGEAGKEYVLGLFLTVCAAALYGFILPLIELMYLKGRQIITYTLLLEIQLIICISATAFCVVGMIINKDFQAMGREAESFGLGEVKYCLVLIFTSLITQCYYLGVVAVIFYSSSLLSGIVIAASLPLTEVLAVIFFHESFRAEKGVSLVLCLWGFCSYFYGEMKQHQNNNKINDEEAPKEDESMQVDQIVVQ